MTRLGLAVVVLALSANACHETFTPPEQPDLRKAPHDFGIAVEDLSGLEDLSVVVPGDDLSVPALDLLEPHDLLEPPHDLAEKRDQS